MNTLNHDNLYQSLRRTIVDEMSLSGFTEDDQLYNLIDRVIDKAAAGCYLSLRERISLRSELFNSFRRLDVLQRLLDDEQITEIMINGPDAIFIEKNRQLQPSGIRFETAEKLEDVIQQIVSRINRRVNTASPIVDARLPDGSRVHVVLPPAALNGPVVTIRKFPEPITINTLLQYETLTPEAAAFLRCLVQAGYNIFISGGTSSGKTTFLNALSGYIPEDERIITIEDSAELQIRHIPNLVRLETRDANSEGKGGIDMNMLISAALRMRPDRIIVGEVRGASAWALMQALNTGHSGSMSTGHANSAADMITRLESMILMAVDIPTVAIRQQIASAIDILIHLERLPDKSRRVTQICEVTGCVNGEVQLSTLYFYDDKEARLKPASPLSDTSKLLRRGIVLPGERLCPTVL